MITTTETNSIPQGRPIEVLNFEDNPDDALLVELGLQKVFLVTTRVTTVRRLEEGLRWLAEKSFDVALVDLKLPDAAGLQTFERLRSEAPHLPLIVLTGNPDDQLAVQILRQGAQDYLLKQEATGPMLARAIRYAIERQRVRVELDSRARELEAGLLEQKRAESRLEKALREKEVLLKEIHHRVKNNLQIISSLLNLQSRRIKDPHTLEMFRESCDRVQLMALLHEKLYGAVDLAQVDFNDYLHSLAAMILRSYANKSRNVTVDFHLHHGLHLGLDIAVPLGLVTSELISNSLKHAFPRGSRGRITLELGATDTRYVLRVSDDGQGLPHDFSLEEPSSLGLRLVKMLAEQLEADLSWSRAPQTTFSLIFQNRTKNRRPNHELVPAQSP